MKLLKNISFFVLFVSTINLIAQDKDCLYATVYGMQKDKPLLENIKLYLKIEEQNFIQIDKIENEITKEKFTDVFKIWGLRYKGEYYYHLSNARGINGIKSFIKIDKTDLDKNYIFFTITEKLPVNMPKSDLENTLLLASSVTGVLISFKNVKSDKYWVSAEGKRMFIYYVDLKKSLKPIAKNLNKKKFKKLFPNEKALHEQIGNNKLLYSEVLHWLEKLN